MNKTIFFDCSCQVGMRGILNPGSFYKVEDLVEHMKSYGIERALVYHSMSKEYNPAIGNDMLINEIKGYPILMPAWVVMHHHTGEFPEPGKLIKLMKENNVKAVRMYPGVNWHNFSIAEWNCGELLRALEREKIALLIGFDQISWTDLHDLCLKHRLLKIILTDINFRINRNIYSLFNKFDNLFIESSGYKAHNGIKEICDKFSSRRIVFGSGMPVLSGAAAVSMINYAQICESDKNNIAHKNLENLLGIK